MTSSAISLALRVATVCGSATSLRLELRRSASASAGRAARPSMRRSNSARVGAAAPRGARPRPCARAGRARAGLAPRRRGSSPGPRTAATVQPSAALAPASSSAPSGSPCAFDGAGLGRRAVADDGLAGDQRRPVGALRPRDARARSPPDRGRRRARRASRRPRSASTWSSESDSDSGPSIEMPLSSNSTISLLSLQMARRARSPPG